MDRQRDPESDPPVMSSSRSSEPRFAMGSVDNHPPPRDERDGLRQDDVAQIVHDLRDPLATIALETYVLDRKLGNGDHSQAPSPNRERATFLHAVSHELRTPLSAILLWAQALRDIELDAPRRRQAIEVILESARSEAEVVDDLLELVMSSTTTLGVTLQPVDPVPIIQAAVDEARGAAGDKQLVIETALAGGPKIDADPRRLRQLTAKLVANAVKFTPSGGTVSVTLAFVDGAMELCVRDTGAGIAPEFLARAFEPFSQADGSSTRAHPGLGISLALVRHFVERQGGTIDVVSSGDGQGAAFTVRLPVPARPSA